MLRAGVLLAAGVLVAACRPAGGVQTATWTLASERHPDQELWIIRRIEFWKTSEELGDERVLWRAAYHSGNGRRLTPGDNDKPVHIYRPSRRGEFWARFEFDASADDGPVPFNAIRISQVAWGSPATQVVLSFAYNHCEHVVHESFSLRRSGRTDIPVKIQDLLDSVCRKMPDRQWHAEGNLSRRCQQAAPVDDFTGQRDPPGASLPRDHDALAETIRRQAQRIMEVNHTIGVLETERIGLHAHIDHQTREIARLTHLLEVDVRTERPHGTQQLAEQIRLLNTQLRVGTLERELLRVIHTRKEKELETLKRKLVIVDGERISLLQNITRKAHEVTSLNQAVAKSECEHAHLLESATRRAQTMKNLDCDAQSPDHRRANHLMNAAPPLVGTRSPGIASREVEPEGGARQVRETDYLKLILATANAERTRLQWSSTRHAREITALNRSLAALERERVRLQDLATHRAQTITNLSRNLQALEYERERHIANAGRNAEETARLNVQADRFDRERRCYLVGAEQQESAIVGLNSSARAFKTELARLRAKGTRQAEEISRLVREVASLEGERDALLVNASHLTTRSSNLVDGQGGGAGQAVAYQQRERMLMGFGLFLVAIRHALASRAQKPGSTSTHVKETASIPSKTMIVMSLAALATGHRLRSRSSSPAPPLPVRHNGQAQSVQQPRVYVVPEYQWPVVAIAVTAVLVVLVVTSVLVRACCSPRRPVTEDIVSYTSADGVNHTCQLAA